MEMQSQKVNQSGGSCYDVMAYDGHLHPKEQSDLHIQEGGGKWTMDLFIKFNVKPHELDLIGISCIFWLNVWKGALVCEW